MKKTGLVMEGGALRGLFTAGVTDVFMERGITFDGAIGTSAGAAFGINLKSRQPGRVLRYNKRFIGDPDYCSMHSLVKTGNLFNIDLCYHQIPEELDPLDFDTFAADPMEFYCTATDVATGRAVYHRCSDCREEDTEWIRASASMPLFATIVKIGGMKLLDGGVADSIPLDYLESLGYNRNVVILTQPADYIKEPNKQMRVVKVRYRHYPAFVKAMAERHLHYNACTAMIAEREAKGELLVIRPPEALNIGGIVKEPEELERVYQIGRREAERRADEIIAYLAAD